MYPALDSAVTAISGTPAISRVIGFDPDDGVLAFVDDKGLPRRLDLRASEARLASKEKLTAITSANGSDLFAITTTGAVVRITPTGDWTFEPPSPARWAFPQPNGSVIVAGTSRDSTKLWLIRPTDSDIIETASFPLVSRGIRTQVGDRLYFTVDSGLIGVQTRDLTPVKGVHLDHQVEAVVPTPSGDRLYVALKGESSLAIVDRYTESVSQTVDLPGPASDLRMDPLGQSILVRPAGDGDSAWVIGVATDRVDGTIRTSWRADLPAFFPGATIATLRGNDVVFVGAANLTDMRTMPGGVRDYWYFAAWNGFRPRAAGLDMPVTFGSGDSTAMTDSTAPVAHNDSIPSPPLRDASPTMIEPPPGLIPQPPRYMVSFAAVLSEQKASETAAAISVNGARPRVAVTRTGSTTIFRVVLGPYASREEAERVGRDSKRQYWVYEVNQ